MADRKYNGIDFSVIAILFVSILITTYISLTFISKKINKQFNSVQKSIDAHIACEHASQTIKDTAAYLTEQAQLFVITHDTKYAETYLNEKYSVRNREKALSEILKVTSEKDEKYQNLLNAIRQSDSLASIELYAIRLAYEAMGETKLPERIDSIYIRPSDVRKTPDERQQVALQAISGKGYLIYKTRVSETCLTIINEIENEIQTNLQKNADSLKHKLLILDVIENALLILSLIFFISLFTLVLIPLRTFILSIRKKERLQIRGSREMRYLAKTYNEVHEFDVLTKILNRRAFAEFCNKYKEDRCDLAFIIIDIDDFKKLNEVYGHSKGDFILQAVASYLTVFFNENSHVTRIGGDQFGILMPNTSKNNFTTLVGKITELNDVLSKLQDFEKVSVSAGIAFSADGYNRDLYEAADKALYQAKTTGKSKAAVSEVIL